MLVMQMVKMQMGGSTGGGRSGGEHFNEQTISSFPINTLFRIVVREAEVN